MKRNGKRKRRKEMEEGKIRGERKVEAGKRTEMEGDERKEKVKEERSRGRED